MNEKTWMSVLEFMCLELMGEVIYRQWLSTTTANLTEAGPDETIYDVELHDWEKRLWILSDVVHDYLEENYGKMIAGDVTEIHRAGDALREIFWAVLHFNHEPLKGHSIGIRKGWKVVRPAKRPNIIVGAGGTPPKALLDAIKNFIGEKE